MPNIASVLKEEISRLARKELKSNTDPLKKAVASYRSQIAALKRRVDFLERQVRKGGETAPRQTEAGDDGPNLRFRPDGLKKHGERLGLSAGQVGKILGVSALSVYHWESGKTRPRAKQLELIAQLRKMGKREAQKKLDEFA